MSDNGIQLGLRAKVHGENTFNLSSDPAGNTYYRHEAGSSGGPAALWDFEFSAHVDFLPNVVPLNLENIRIDLFIDTDPSLGVHYVYILDVFNPTVVFNPDPFDYSVSDPSIFNLANFGDHKVGTDTTGNGGGLVYDTETVGTTLADYTVVQNVLNIGELINGFDPNAPGDYHFLLNAYDTVNKVKLNSAWMRVEVGAVPEPSTFAIFLLLPMFGIALGWRNWRHKT